MQIWGDRKQEGDMRYVSVAACLLLAASWAWGQIVHQETIAPGVTYTKYAASGPNNVYVVAIDKSRSEYRFKVGWSQGKRNYTARQPVSQICSNYDLPPAQDVLAGINGSFIDTQNPPRMLGVGQTDGEMLDTPAFNPSYTYHTVMVGPERMPVVRTNFNHAQGTIRFADGYSMPLTQYNYYMNGPLAPINGVSAFTPSFDSSTRTSFLNPSLSVEVVIANVSYPMRGDKEVSGIITAVNTPTSGNAAIPAGGMVLSAWGSTRAEIVAHAHVGQRIRVRVASGAEEYNNSDNALTGIGWIMHNGTAYTPGWANLESGAAPYSRNPRTALAWNNTTWFMMVCDGRTGISVGMTFQEMTDFLAGTLGATEAVNYDGGGSSTMLVNGTVRNSPSDGGERYLGNAIMLIKRPVTNSFPMSDVFASSGRGTGWDDKFTFNDVIPFAPAAPNSDGYVMNVINPLGAVETVRRGDYADTNYSVSADLYCEYRPGTETVSGREHYALFARDSGSGALGLGTYGKGNCYALVYDSSNGRVMPGKYVDGTFTDFLESAPIYMPATAWRRFRINCQGTSIRYFVDDTPVAEVSDSTFSHGYCGLGYQSFVVGTDKHGTRADNFQASELGAPPGQASNPSPARNAIHAPVHPVLSWTAGANAASHAVFFGDQSPGAFQGNQSGTSFDPGSLELDKTYYWRVDESNENGTTIGEVWSFTTQRYLGDMNNDADVDQEDFGMFQTCLTGTGNAQYDAACKRALLDSDGDVDTDDVIKFIQCHSGPGVTPDAACLSSPN